jgi:capsular polysaccharide biosynthesis protein
MADIMMRNAIAVHLPRAFVQLQRRGIYPDPLKGRNARRLGMRAAHARYDETILGRKQVRATPISTAIRPDDATGRRYAEMLEQSAHVAGPKECYGYFDVPDVKIWPEFGVHASPAGNFIDVYCGNALTNPKYELTRRALNLRPADSRMREGVFIAPSWFHNFYHWMIDLVPRLELVADVLRQGLPLIGPPHMRDWQRSTLLAVLEELGLGDIEIIEPQGGVLRFERMVLPTNITQPLDVSPEQLDLLRRSLLKTARDVATPRRIYVSRRDAANRRMENEDEVCAHLGRRGFQAVTMSELTPADQAALFHGAEVVVGAHGAALTNLAFCREGATVIELFRDGHFQPCFARIAQSAKLHYGFGVGRPLGADTHLDVRQLERLLDMAGV